MFMDELDHLIIVALILALWFVLVWTGLRWFGGEDDPWEWRA